MNALFKKISSFFQRLLGLGEQTPSSRPPAPSMPTLRPSLDTRWQGHSPGVSQPDLENPLVTSKLRRLVYEVAYRLRQDKPTQGAQVGPVFRRVDPDFSAKRYGFAKMFDLLDTLPALVSIEKEPTNRETGQFIFYVRPVNDVRTLLSEALQSYSSEDGWVHEDSLKQAIAQKDPTFSVQTYGFSSFRAFIESRHDLLEFKEVGSPYVRLFPEKSAQPNKITSLEKRQDLPARPVPSPISAPNRVTTLAPVTVPKPTKQKINVPLTGFARLGEEDFNQSIYELAELADDEPWYFGSEPPADFPHPILRNYIRHMFTRLQSEGKVASSQGGHFYAFNTNLYDKLRRPIYALMTPRPSEGDEAYGRPALKLEFCVPGEGIGKNLVGHFGVPPLAANFMITPQRFFYYCEAGSPTVNWKHVIEDNMDRLPPAFLCQYLSTFEFCDTEPMSKIEVGEYKARFAEALGENAAAYREIVGRFEKALELTMLRIQMNYKMAVPTYFASHDRIDLMLPLSLMNESTTDCVIVVKRERSGNYSGNTIFTMEQAYNNARLIYKPMQRWLVHPKMLQPAETAQEKVD